MTDQTQPLAAPDDEPTDFERFKADTIKAHERLRSVLIDVGERLERLERPHSDSQPKR